MKLRQKTEYLGLLVIGLAVVLRLLSADFFDPFAVLLQKNGAMSVLLYASTGTLVRYADAPQMPLPAPEQPQPQPDEPLPQDRLSFFPNQLDAIEVDYQCSYRPELGSLLTKPLAWDLADGQPAVLILHSHATESYTGEDIPYTGTYRTLDGENNMLCIGAELARVLRAGGIEVICDTALHDYPEYNTAYQSARSSIATYLARYPSIRLVLDLHRDASDSPYGQLVTSATVGGQESAQLMMVVGTDAGGNYHPDWQENLALALKLTALLEENNPGISRPVTLRKERFNMDLSPGSLLIEVGAAGNTRQEAILAANALGQAILQLAKGSA